MQKSKKGDHSAKYLQLTDTIYMPKIMILAQAIL